MLAKVTPCAGVKLSFLAGLLVVLMHGQIRGTQKLVHLDFASSRRSIDSLLVLITTLQELKILMALDSTSQTQVPHQQTS